MISRVLTELGARILREKQSRKVDCLMLERATYFVRQGNTADLDQLVCGIRIRYQSQPDAEVSSWLHLVEGLNEFYTSSGLKARDRLMRAHAISAAGGLKRLHGLSAAWLAHLDYAKLDIDSMVIHLQEAFSTASDEHHDTHARAGLVMAQALHLANRLDLALPWYSRVRKHATVLGDDLTLSALMHNMAWLRMSALRQLLLCEGCAPQDKLALMGAESTENFDEIIGSTVWNELIPALKAQILSLLGRPSEARNLYEQAFAQRAIVTAERLKANMLADFAWCKSQTGAIESAFSDALRAANSFEADSQVDDVAAAHSRLSQVFGELGHSDLEATHAKLATAAWANHSALQLKLVRLLGSVTG